MRVLEDAFRRVHRVLKPRTPVPRIRTEFFPSVGANHSATLDRGVLRVRVSDLFVDAPSEILESIAAILLSKLYGKEIDKRHHVDYRRYTMSRRMLERSRRTRTERGRAGTTTDPQGKHYDLVRLFESVNLRYFGGRLRQPVLSWTQRRARTVLGRYDFDQDVIFVSRFLDSDAVPEHVVEYVLFHEMLHVKHGTEIRDLREIAHTAAFRRDEQRFAHYGEAHQWLATH